MAQLVEQRIRNAWVAGSSPAVGSIEQPQVRSIFLACFLLPKTFLSGQCVEKNVESRFPTLILMLVVFFAECPHALFPPLLSLALPRFFGTISY